MLDELERKVRDRKAAIAITGLGYVGLPRALGFSNAGFPVIGFDISKKRVEELRKGEDHTLEAKPEELAACKARFTSDEKDLADADIHILTVPTPVDEYSVPDLQPVRGASESSGRNFREGKLIVLESTVYPGVTEEMVVTAVERLSGKKYGKDFVAGYSPERINPGDREHALGKVVKVVSGTDEQTAQIMKELYTHVSGGIFVAKSIKAAEAAKVIENTQRDINIALINELTILFEKMGISIWDVLEASETKWNFLRFRPGLVGGHCIPVDPYYLVYKAQQLGFHPQMIAAGRRVNDGMAAYVASRLVKEMIRSGALPKGSSGAVFGLTFKENVPDTRSSLVKNVIRELKEYGIAVYAHDPYLEKESVEAKFGAKPLDEAKKYDFVLLAVAHEQLKSKKPAYFAGLLKKGGLFFDLKRIFGEKDFSAQGARYLTL